VASQEPVRWTQNAGFAVVHLVGDLDLASAGPTFAAIAEGRPATGDLVIDLTGVDFMDSTALGHLVGFGPDEVIRVVAPDGTGPRRVLEITNLTSRFPTFETVDEAVAARD
jgi:anti-anti-sigma factor